MNRDIKAPEVRLIGDDGKMVGVMSVADALQAAQSKGLDLIEIAPQAKPPTCKIMDYGKWKYENKKKEKEARKKQTVISIKEIQIRPRTEDHDLETKLKNATKFLLAGDKVKVNLRFSGREMAHQDLGLELLTKVTEMLGHIANVEAPPKKEGRQMFVLMSPDAAKIKDWEKKQKAEGKSIEVEADADSESESQAETQPAE
ncbi:MAG: translation initiation factor IF-3 [Bdellovibrionales bacterium]|nr:translation initiation factor IF-3 [Bdellovibrionales bacterium]